MLVLQVISCPSRILSSTVTIITNHSYSRIYPLEIINPEIVWIVVNAEIRTLCVLEIAKTATRHLVKNKYAWHKRCRDVPWIKILGSTKFVQCDFRDIFLTNTDTLLYIVFRLIVLLFTMSRQWYYWYQHSWIGFKWCCMLWNS